MGTIGGSGDWASSEVARGDRFLEDIKKNVQELEETVSRGIAVDHEFVRILLHDIDAIRNSSKFSSAAKARELDDLSQRVLRQLEPITTYTEQMEADKASRARGVPPASLHEEMPIASPLEDASKLTTLESLQPGIQKLRENFSVRLIRPDGHCLFRSYVTSLLAGPYDKEELAARLRQLSDKGLIDTEDLPVLAHSLQGLHNAEQLEAVIADPQISERWVKVVRRLAGEAMMDKLETASDQEIRTMAIQIRSFVPAFREIPDDREVVQQYALGIASMEKRWYGGAFEIQFLDELLGTETQEVNLEALSRVLDLNVEMSKNPRAIYLVQRGMAHVDAAFPKNPSLS